MKQFIFLLLSLVFFSCSSHLQQVSSTPSYADDSKSEDFESTQNLSETRKILYTAYLSLAVEQPDSVQQQLQQIAEKYKGYVSSISTYQSVIRVESSSLDAAMNEVATLGKLQDKSLTGYDVTEEFADYEIRLENAQKTRLRYLALLKQATTVDEILQVERELERLNEKIELLKGKMNRLDHLSSFSTININLKQLQKPGPLGYVGIGIYRAVKWLFVRG